MTLCNWMDSKEKFHYLNTEYPYLVLYTHASPHAQEDPHGELYALKGGRPDFKDPEKWFNIMHQTAGYACHHYYIYAKFLEPKKEIQPLLFELLKKYNDSCISRNPSLSVAIEYENLLKKYNLSANYDYTYLEEGFYPIDLDFLSKVTSEKLPKDLQALVKPIEEEEDLTLTTKVKGKSKTPKTPKTPKATKKARKKLWSFLNRVNFNLAVLGPNCD